MKKFTRTMALLLIGGSTLVTSCVSEDISPEVENLRQAQVNYLNSKAAMEQANADNQTAQTAKIQAETALIQLQVELEQAIMQAQAEAEIAAMEAAVAQAEADVAVAKQGAAAAELALQEALTNLAAQANATAKKYLEMYEGYMEEANGKLEQISSLEQKLVKFNAYVDANGNIVDFDGTAAEIEVQLSEDEATLAALEATITRLEELNTDATSVESELMEVMTELDALRADLATANLNANRFYEETYEDIHDAYLAANNSINSISNLEERIAIKELNIADVEETISSLESQITPFQTELDATEGEFRPAVEQAETLLEAWIQARATFIAADLNNDSGDEQYDAAKQDLDDAIAAFESYAGTGYPSNPQTIRDTHTLTTYADPASELGIIITQYTNVLHSTTFWDLQNRLSTAFTNQDKLINGYWNGSSFIPGLNNLNSDLEYQQSELDSIYTEMGVTDLSELQTLYQEASETYQAKFEVRNELYAEVSALIDLQNTFEIYLNGTPSQIENRIESLKMQINYLQADIDDAEAALVNNEISAEEWAANIVRTEERIDRQTVEYDALVALANDFLELFNAEMED